MPKARELNVDRQLADVVNEIRRPKLQAETGWYNVGEEWAASEPIEIDFLNSWSNVGVTSGVTNAPAGWYLSEDGEVRLRGKIDGGTLGVPAFILPEEVRPEYAETFICAVEGGGKANVTVHANGEVIVDTIT